MSRLKPLAFAAVPSARWRPVVVLRGRRRRLAALRLKLG
jgi:hypothetical protein